MRERLRDLFSFPNPVNEVAARTVAAGVVVLSVAAPGLRPALDARWPSPTASGPGSSPAPRLSPLGQLATRVVAPNLGVAPRPTPGPPKRFAQAIGAVLSTVAVVLWATAGWRGRPVAPGAGGRGGRSSRRPSACAWAAGSSPCSCGPGLIPAAVCEECADVTRRHPELARSCR